MSDDKLNLYDDKTEFLLVGTKQQLAKVCIKDNKVGCVEISPSSSVRNLGMWFDSSLNVSEHITKLCASAFFYIYNIRRIRKYLSRDSAETLVHAFISSRSDYGIPYYLVSLNIRFKSFSECRMLLLVSSFLCVDIVTSLHFSLIYTVYQ